MRELLGASLVDAMNIFMNRLLDGEKPLTRKWWEDSGGGGRVKYEVATELTAKYLPHLLKVAKPSE